MTLRLLRTLFGPRFARLLSHYVIQTTVNLRCCKLLIIVVKYGRAKVLSVSVAAWLRTANNNNYYNANYLTADGVNNNDATSAQHLVRPALRSLAYVQKMNNGKGFSRIRRVH